MVTEHLERKTLLNTISIDKEKLVEEQIESICQQINSGHSLNITKLAN